MALWPWNVPQKSMPTTSTASTIVPILPKPSNASEKSHKNQLNENKATTSNSKNKRNHGADANTPITNKRNRSAANATAIAISSASPLAGGSNAVDAIDGASEHTKVESKRATKANIANKLQAQNNCVSVTLPTNATNTNGTLNVRSQTKITGFFKTQVKALPSIASQKDQTNLANMVIRSTDFPAIMLPQQSNDESKALAPPPLVPTSSVEEANTLCQIAQNHRNTNVSVGIRPLPLNSTIANAKKVERKTAKVSPISRKSNTIKKSTYATVLPKKHVNIAPRTNTTSMTIQSTALTTMADSVKSQQSKALLTQQQVA